MAVERFPNGHKALGHIPRTQRKRKEGGGRSKEGGRGGKGVEERKEETPLSSKGSHTSSMGKFPEILLSGIEEQDTERKVAMKDVPGRSQSLGP